MNIETQDLDGVTIVRIAGRQLIASNTDIFKKAFAAVPETTTHFIIDLGDLEFIDSTGLGAIVNVLKAVRTRDGDIKLCSMSDPVYRTFELVKLNRVFQIFPSLNAALASSLAS